MIIDIDLTSARAVIELVKPEDCNRFHVAARGGSPEALADALAAPVSRRKAILQGRFMRLLGAGDWRRRFGLVRKS